MKIGVVTDEVNSDVESALELIGSSGVDVVELRGIGLERFLAPSELQEISPEVRTV